MKIDPANLDKKGVHDLLAGAIMPRAIAFVSTIGEDGVFNVAPFSFFTSVSIKPAMVGFNAGWKDGKQKKDTLVNIELSKDFVINFVNEALAEAMNQASKNYPSNVDEFEEVGLTPVKADIVKPPMVAESPINMECRLVQILEFGDDLSRSSFIIGEVVRVHVKDELYVNDRIQVTKLTPIGRLGEQLYCRITDIFEMKRPEPRD